MTYGGKRGAGRRSAAALTYDATRDREQLAVHEGVIDEFIRNYKEARPAPSAPRRQTLFFFPGGMACQLKRSGQKFKDGVANQKFSYRTKWLNCATFLGGALQLGMAKDSDGIYRDKGNRIVIADGAVNLGGRTPHDGLIQWCADNNIDLFVFNWDWRRRQEDAARFFVEQFWPLFKARAKAAGIGEAARDFSLLGHSFGGMIVNLILRREDPQVARCLARAVTVATPFYGYAGQAHRWFEGEPYLNGDGDRVRDAMIRVIASMPGLYVLHFLDAGVTFARDKGALANDRDYPLARYPSLDARSGDPFDPWTPQPNGAYWVRYPFNMGFRMDELDHAARVFRRMAEPMNDRRFFNIRGVQLARDGKTARKGTVGGVSCDWIRTDFDPDHGSPVRDDTQVPGDGTQPAWTARLATNDPARCMKVVGKNVEHMFLMSDAGTLEALSKILLGTRKSRIRPPRLPRLASDGEVGEFLDWLHKYGKTHRGRALGDDAIREALPSGIRRMMPRVARRIIEDILKRPHLLRE